MTRFLIASLLYAAALVPAAAAQSEGLPPEWETKKNLQELADQVKKYKPLLDSLKPRQWTDKGASETYVKQYQSAQDQINYLVNATGRLAQQPDKMSLALETYFRFQSLDTMVASVSDAVRKYQNPAIAELLQSQLTETAPFREKLRQYVLTLITVKEQEFAVADREAQRCRETMSKQPAAPPARKQERK